MTDPSGYEGPPPAAPAPTPLAPMPAAPVPAAPVPPAPVAVPSFGLPPVQPAPPTYDPSLLMQTMPVSGPYAPAPAPAGGGGSKVAVIVLSVLLGLIVLASAVLGTLLVREGQESARRSDQVAQLQTQTADLERRLAAAERNLDASDDDLADLQEERDAMAACLNGFVALGNALSQSGGERTPEVEALALEVDRTCRAAEAYL